MGKKPTDITVTDIPDADLKEFLDEIAEEGKFEVAEKTKSDGVWTLKLHRKVA